MNPSPYDLYCVGGTLNLTQSINQPNLEFHDRWVSINAPLPRASNALIQNLSEIEQSDADLLRLQYVEFVAVRHFGFDRKWFFTTSRPPGPTGLMHQPAKFHHSRQCSAELLMMQQIFPRVFQGGLPMSHLFYELGGWNCTTFVGDVDQIATNVCFSRFFSKPGRLKCKYCRKNDAKFRSFTSI